MVILGIILLLLGLLLPAHWLFVVGIVLLLVGIVLNVVPFGGTPRRWY